MVYDSWKKRKTETDWDAVPTESPLAKQLGGAKRRVHVVLAGSRPVVFICGGAGIGKTKAILDILNGRKSVRHLPSTRRDLEHCFEQSNGRTPIVLEECDNIFKSVPCLNLLKLATDPDGPRFVEVRVPPKKKGAASTTKRISLKAPLVVALNGDLTDESQWPKECRRHIQAMCSREQPILIYPSREQAWEYSCYLALRKEMLRRVNGLDVSIALQNHAIRWFTEHLYSLKEVSPRSLCSVLKFFVENHRLELGPHALADDLDTLLGPPTSNGLPPRAPSLFVKPKQQRNLPPPPLVA